VIARQGNRLAYVEESGRINLWRTDISASDPPTAGATVRMMSSASYDVSPAYSPNGQKIAFASEKTGNPEIWEAAPDGSKPVQLTHTGGASGTPRWSPDGSAIVFDGPLNGNPEIMVVTEEGRKIRRITNNPAEDEVPSWSNDGRWIYFASNRNGAFQIFKIRSDQEESPSNLPIQVTTRGGFNAMESPDGKYLYYARGRTEAGGLWRRQLEGAPGGIEEQVLGSLQCWGWWTLSSNAIFFLESEHANPMKVHLRRLDLRSKHITDLRALEFLADRRFAPLTVSPDGLHVVYQQTESFGNRIMLIENFR